MLSLQLNIEGNWMSFRFIKYFIVTLLSLSMTTALAVETDTMLLVFEDQDSQDESPYVSRMLLTKDYLRMDDGKDDGDFALYDRKTGTVYSVSHEDQRTLVISLQAVDSTPNKPLRHDFEKLDSSDLPTIDGRKVSRYYLFTNGRRCMEVYAVPGLYEDAVKAMAGFAKTLAGQHAKTMQFIPDDVSSDCDLANNIFVPDRYLSKGFPVRQIDYTGRRRSLVSVKEKVKFDSSMFDLPPDYQKFMPGGITQ